MSTQSTTSTNTNGRAGSRDEVVRADAKWPLWKTFAFIIVFCSIAWTAIFLFIFNLFS